MRISGTQISYSVYGQAGVKSVIKSSDKVVTNTISPTLSAYPIGYTPSQINFGANLYSALPEILQLKKIKNLPCIYCGRPMIPSHLTDDLCLKNNLISRTMSEYVDMIYPTRKSLKNGGAKAFNILQKQAFLTPDRNVDSLVNKLSEEFDIPEFMKRNALRDLTPGEYTQRVIDIIAPYEDSLMPVEKVIFQEIKTRNSGADKKSIQDIMFDLRKLTISKLASKHISTITDIENLANTGLSKPTRAKLLTVTEEARNQLRTEDPSNPFKRKTFIGNINALKGDRNETKTLQELVKLAEKLPTSENDIGAFIAKYSLKERSNEEIAQRLILPSITSVEHIRTQESYKNNNHIEVAKDTIANLALAHRCCNQDRDNLSLSQYILEYPEVKPHIQGYVDFVSLETKYGALSGMDNYPLQIKTAYEQGTNGAIRINLPITK